MQLTKMSIGWDWPRDDTLQWMQRCHEVAMKLMRCFATGLGLPEDFFDDVSSLSCCYACICLPHKAACSPASRASENDGHGLVCILLLRMSASTIS